MEQNNNGVKWKVFVWIMGVILLLFSVAFGIIGSTNGGLNNSIKDNTAKIDKNSNDLIEVKVFIAATNEILKNINQNLSEIKTELKK